MYTTYVNLISLTLATLPSCLRRYKHLYQYRLLVRLLFLWHCDMHCQNSKLLAIFARKRNLRRMRAQSIRPVLACSLSWIELLAGDFRGRRKVRSQKDELILCVSFLTVGAISEWIVHTYQILTCFQDHSEIRREPDQMRFDLFIHLLDYSASIK